MANAIGPLVDKITSNNRRKPARVATRALEEMTEVALAAGASATEILAAVSDAIHNQCLKASIASGVTVFPSQLVARYNMDDVISELGDARLCLNDLEYVCGIDPSWSATAEALKFQKLQATPLSQFNTDGQTFYLVKPHVK